MGSDYYLSCAEINQGCAVVMENTRHMLKTVFNVDSGLSEDAAIRIYRRSALASGKLDVLKEELALALRDSKFSWKELLLNDDYEVLDAETEGDARSYAVRILWDPLQGL